jgi:hypothetical protein
MPAVIPYLAAALTAVYPGAALVAVVATFAVNQSQRYRAEQRARQQKADAIRTRNITLRSALAPRTVVLGTARTSGPLMYAEFVGPTEEWLDSIVAINHGEIGQMVGVYIGDQFIAAADINGSGYPTAGKYAGSSLDPVTVEQAFAVTAATSVTLANTPEGGVVSYVVQSTGSGDSFQQNNITPSTSVAGLVVSWSTGAFTGDVTVGYRTSDLIREPLRVQWATGSASQATTTWSGVTTPRWTANHRLRGVAYVRTLKLIDHPLFLAGDSGDVGAVVRGPAGVWDPRTSTTLSHSSNPALLAAWFRTRPVADGGLGVPTDWIDWATVSTAANICDELISVRKLDNTGYENVKRYECNTRLSLDSTPADNLRVILDAMAGDFPFTGGYYKCFAGAFRAATVTLTDDDVLAADAINFAPQSGASVAPPNVVTATFYDAARGWVEQPALAVTNTTYVTDDGAEEILELDLQASTDQRQANYLMGVQLERARPALAAALTVTGKGANLGLLDTVQFNLQGYSSIAGKTFEVRRRTNQWNGRYPLQLVEVKASTYALDADRFTAAAAVSPPANSLLFDVTPVSVTGVVEQLQRQADGTLISVAEVTWSAHPQGFVREGGSIRLRWRRAGAAEWVYGAPISGAALKGYTGALVDGTVVVIEAQATNGRGGSSVWVPVPPLPVVGKSALPANPTSVAATQVPGGVLLTWALNTEADYLDTEIRAGASWAAGTLQWRGTADRYLLPWPAAGALTLWVAHRDTSKGYSATPVSVALTVGAASLIGTPQIGLGAASQTFTTTGGSAVTVTGTYFTPDGYASGRNTLVATVSFTAAANGEVIVTADAAGSFVNSTASVSGGRWSIQQDGGTWDGWKRIEKGIPASASELFAMPTSRRFAVVSGVSYSFSFYASKLNSGDTFTVSNFELVAHVRYR